MKNASYLFSYIGPVAIGLITLVPVVVWLTLNPVSERMTTSQDIFASLGKVFSLAGFVLFALNLLLSTRLRFLEDIFGGLNKVYKTHHIVGGLSLSLLLFHPLFLAASYIEIKNLETIKDAATFLLPKAIDFTASSSALQQAIAFNAGGVAFFGMVVLLVITFFVNLPYQVWLFTHKFLGVAFLLAAVHTLLISSDTNRNDFLHYYMLVIAIIGLASYSYRTILGNIVVRRATYRVSRNFMQGNVLMAELEPVGKSKISFSPGQFVFMRFKKDDNIMISGEAHPFSMASAPDESNLRFYIKALGDYTNTLEKLKIGQLAELEGAFGKFSYTNFPNTSQIWIAGGIGVTPFISMARSLKSSSPVVDMYYSVKSRSELIEQSTLQDFLPIHYPNFKYHPYVSDEEKTFLTAEIIQNQVGSLKDKEIFICGPGSMMKSLRKQFKDLGVPSHKIHTEEFSI